MNLITQLNTFFEEFLHLDFDENKAAKLLGKPIHTSTHRWYLKPMNADLSEIRLNFEDLEAGQNLLTSMDFRFYVPLQSTLTDLMKIFGTDIKWLPRFNPNRPRGIAFHKETEFLNGTVIINTDACPKTSVSEDIRVFSILMRRYFPPPPR
jgi:hypothetical protein